MTTLGDRIGAAARELYLREGLDGFSLRKVAEMVGVSAPAIYRHYPSKRDLLNEIVLEGLEVLRKYLEPALHAETPLERLSRMIDGYFDFAMEQPKFFELAFLIPAHAEVPLDLNHPKLATFRQAVEQVAACMKQGELRRDDPLQTAITLWAEAHGLVCLYRVGRFPQQNREGFRQLYRGAVDRVIAGLRD